MSDYFPSSAETTQDADLFELSVSCVGVVPCLAPAEFCTTLSSQSMLIVNAFFFRTTSWQTAVVKWRRRILRRGKRTGDLTLNVSGSGQL